MNPRDCVLTLVFPVMLEEEIVDHLLEHPEWVTGFTNTRVEGQGAGGAAARLGRAGARALAARAGADRHEPRGCAGAGRSNEGNSAESGNRLLDGSTARVREVRMKALPYVILLLPALVVAAPPDDTPDLPPRAVVASILAGHPDVLAAKSGVRYEESNRARLEAGEHEFSLSLGTARRSTETSRNHNEWDIAVERPIRLPGKARLDGELGSLGVAQAQSSWTMPCTRRRAACCAPGSAG
ncbi:MAG: DUF3240 family protein [Rhodocyclaceae bacterium]|nr:DUF3240 family protein [Rhodocyclaceae bacterium]